MSENPSPVDASRTAPLPGPSLRTAALFATLALVFASASATAQAPPPKEGKKQGKKVSGKELLEQGFFQDFAELSLEELLNPEEVKVEVASPEAVSLERAPGMVSVIRSEEIRNLGALTLGDALRLVPGLDITIDNLGRPRVMLRGVPSGLPGGAGGASENVLVLFDGQRLNEDVNGGATTLNFDLPADHIRQVEVLRGPGAALYGDAALVGVINVVTQTGADLVGTEVGVDVGSFGVQQYVLRSGGAIKEVQISGFVRFVDTSGARRLIAADAQTLADQQRVEAGLAPISLAPGPATDGRHALDTSYRFGFRDFSLGVRSRQEKSDGYIGYANALGKQNNLNNRQIGAELSYRHALAAGGTLRARGSFAQNEIRQLLQIYPSGFVLPTENGGFVLYGRPGGDGGVFLQTGLSSRRWGVEAQLEREAAAKHTLVAGVGLAYESTFDLKADANMDLRTSTPIPPGPSGSGLGPLPGAVRDAHRTVFSFQAQDAWTASPRLTLTGGFRFDHGSDFGGTLNPRVALVGSLPEWLEKHLPRALGPALSFKLLYGRAFRAPTFRELYFDLPGYAGNPELKPAVADTMEAALLFRRSRLKVGLNGFLSLVRNAIVPEGPFSPTALLPIVNAAGYHVWGLQAEATGGFGLDDAFFANYTFQRGTDRATSTLVADVPSHLANLGATLNFRERYSVTPTVLVRGSRPRAAGDPRPPVGGYALVGLTARARGVYRTLEVVLSVQNLFDEDYRDPSPLGGVPGDYPRPGRSIRLHAAFRF